MVPAQKPALRLEALDINRQFEPSRQWRPGRITEVRGAACGGAVVEGQCSQGRTLTIQGWGTQVADWSHEPVVLRSQLLVRMQTQTSPPPTDQFHTPKSGMISSESGPHTDWYMARTGGQFSYRQGGNRCHGSGAPSVTRFYFLEEHKLFLHFSVEFLGRLKTLEVRTSLFLALLTRVGRCGYMKCYNITFNGF